jgi:hypothetical protein
MLESIDEQQPLEKKQQVPYPEECAVSSMIKAKEISSSLCKVVATFFLANSKTTIS